MARAIITIPNQIKRGKTIEISALIQHPMETGYRRSNEGAMLERNLIRQFTCAFESANGKSETIFSATLHAAIAANPYLAFNFTATENGTLVFNWTGDNGFSQTERRALKIS